MFETIITERQKNILTILAQNEVVHASVFSDLHISRATFSREMKLLIAAQFVIREGKGGGVRYRKGDNFFLAPIDIDRYFSTDQNNRYIASDTAFFASVCHAFSEEEKAQHERAAQDWHTRYTATSDTIKKKELERITIELSWKSSQIEGNTYTLLDTERLIKESVEAHNHSREEAIMILNHKRAFTYLYEHTAYYKTLTKKNIHELHALLIDGLNVPTGIRSGRVGIVGTNYTPYDNRLQLEAAFDALIAEINAAASPIDKAFCALVGISYLQLFEDGNKRLSRMLANAILFAHNFPPMSFRSIDEVEYKKALIIAYEAKNVFPMKMLFLEQLEHAAHDYF